MAVPHSEEQEASVAMLKQKQIKQYWAADLGRRMYLFRRQRKAILENCRRVAVVAPVAIPTVRALSQWRDCWAWDWN